MLFTWKRLKKLIPVLLLIVFALAIFASRDALKSRLDPFLNFLPWWESDENGDDMDESSEDMDEGSENSDAADSTDVTDENDESDARPINVVTDSEQIEVLVEDARTSREREVGLMYRESLCENCGMVFTFDSDVSGGFWMRNCEISLDLIFIDSDGSIVDIKEEFEPCREDPCPVYRPGINYRYVLEVNGGWTSKHDVSAGDSVDNI